MTDDALNALLKKNKLRGDGKTGFRLWFRTKDGWIKVPFGDGGDSKVRTVNIYDGSQWLTATWGGSVLNINAPEPLQIDALNVRAPGRVWLNTPENVTYDAATGQMYTPGIADWIRLLYLEPKVDPTWRIVPLGVKLPAGPPSASKPAMFMLSSYGGITSDYVEEPHVGDPIIRFERGPLVTMLDSINDWQRRAGRIRFGQATYDTDSPHVYAAPNRYTIKVSQMLDLRALRKQLAENFSEVGVDYVGVYDPIQLMSIRRIYLRYRVHASLKLWTEAGITEDYQTVAFNFCVLRNTDPGVPLTHVHARFDERAPTSGQFVQGETLYTFQGFSTVSSTYVADPPGDEQPYFRTEATFTSDILTAELEDPGQDNLTFFATVENFPIVGPGFHDYAEYNIDVELLTVTVHYAEPDSDTPYERQRPDAYR